MALAADAGHRAAGVLRALQGAPAPEGSCGATAGARGERARDELKRSCRAPAHERVAAPGPHHRNVRRESASSASAAPRRWWTRSASSRDRKSTRLNSSHSQISYAVFCLKKKKNKLGTDELADIRVSGDEHHDWR